ncbi:MAG: CopD family protein [Gammaproteobacteria bacterium]|nr:CopD family protein [Gammaproteobacteria bacterium]MDH3378314.1 CopD family protein [Gammaproteobacteria bacterium]
MNTALFLHLLSAVIWVGGMFFAYLCLRPAAGALEPPVRLGLWVATFERFFVWVWTAVVLLPATGYWLIARLGGFGSVGVYVHIMHALGIAMILVFLHVYFAPYRRLRGAVASGDFAVAAKHLNQIRILVAINLSLGMLVLATVRLLR